MPQTKNPLHDGGVSYQASGNAGPLVTSRAGGISYIPAVDGLRAVAIVPVILFHCGTNIFRGGFVGVDVFFVISGFLITSLIVRSIEKGEFSIADFYRRRIRRIFPALFVMMATALMTGYFLLLPARFDELARSALSAALSLSNLYFWRFSGYFDTKSEEQPLLHTWSLGVEEQYYLLFPLALAILYKIFREKPKAAVITLLVISLSISVWLTPLRPTAGFYLLPARAWEMMLGGLLAFLAPTDRGKAINSVVGVAGLTAITVAVFSISTFTPWPGYAALLPTTGAALTIYSIRMGSGAASAMLATGPMVAVGRMSYSLYLWHWPILVFARYLTQPTLSARVTVIAIMSTVVVSALSWRYVEQPFRRQNTSIGRAEPLKWGAVVMAATVAFCSIAIWAGGFSTRLRSLPFHYSEDTAYFCSARQFPATISQGHSCGLNGIKRVSDADFVVWGDSNAEMLLPAFEQIAADAGKNGVILSYGGCTPLLGADRYDSKYAGVCDRFNDEAFKAIVSNPRIKHVILSAVWVSTLRGYNFEFEAGTPVTLRDVVEPKPGDNNASVMRRSLIRTIEALHKAGKTVLLIEPIPELGRRGPQEVAKDLWLGRPLDGLAPTPTQIAKYQAPFLDIADHVHNAYGIPLFNLTDLFCERQCRVMIRGSHLYRDADHLSEAGVAFVQPQLVKALSAWLVHV